MQHKRSRLSTKILAFVLILALVFPASAFASVADVAKDTRSPGKSLANTYPAYTDIDWQISLAEDATATVTLPTNLTENELAAAMDAGLSLSLDRDTQRGYLNPEKFPNPYQGGPLDSWKTQRDTQMFQVDDYGFAFDDDGKVYLVYGGGQIWCIELEKDLSAVKPGTKRKLINDAGLVKGCLAEGSHVYKLNGYYYIFIITWPPHGRRTQLCYRSKALDGEWEMKVIIDDNMGFRNDGAAQGGIVDDKDGNWYCFVFQDHGAVGRTPVLSTMTWEDGWPVVGVDGKVPKTAKIPFAGHEKKSVVTSDEFINSQIVRSYHSFADTPEEAGESDYNGSNLGLEWQWNHNPDNRLWSLTERKGYLRLRTVDVCGTVANARNTLTQRTFGPECGAYIKLDVSEMKEGDVAGFAAFAEKYGYVAVKIEDGKKYIVTVWYDDNDNVEQEFETERVEIAENEVYLRVDCDFKNAADKAYFYYSLDGDNWTKIGDTLQMNYYGLHFMGYRYAIFNFPTKQSGGYVDVDFFRVENKLLK